MSNDRNGSYRGSRSPSARSYTKSRSRSISKGRRRSRSGSYRYSSSRRRSPSPYSRRHGDSSYAPDRLNPPASSVLGVFGLGLHTTERDLKDLFGKYGKINQLRIIVDKRTNKSRGFGFIYFDKVEDAKEAKKKCHGAEVDGKNIRVDYSIGERDYSQLPPSRPPPYRSSRRYRDDSPYGSPYNSRRERASPIYKRYSRSRSRSYERRGYRRSSSYRR